jgi:hypothetical protein
MSYMLSLSEQTKLNAFLSGILDDYKTGVSGFDENKGITVR